MRRPADAPRPLPYCAIDFGTSNSGIAVPTGRGDGAAVELVEIEAGRPTLPTAVFYGVEGLGAHEEPRRLYGRAAIAAYVEGQEGRLMRSMKSILGSSLVEQRTELGAGHSVRYLDVLSCCPWRSGSRPCALRHGWCAAIASRASRPAWGCMRSGSSASAG